MAKNLEISVLIDYYGNMLTEKQREVVEWYYNEDLSLAEIAEHTGITRQGVRDSIKRAELQLLECEERLGFCKRFETIQELLEKISDQTVTLQEETMRMTGSQKLWDRAQQILTLAEQINS